MYVRECIFCVTIYDVSLLWCVCACARACVCPLLLLCAGLTSLQLRDHGYLCRFQIVSGGVFGSVHPVVCGSDGVQVYAPECTSVRVHVCVHVCVHWWSMRPLPGISVKATRVWL